MVTNSEKIPGKNIKPSIMSKLNHQKKYIMVDKAIENSICKKTNNINLTNLIFFFHNKNEKKIVPQTNVIDPNNISIINNSPSEILWFSIIYFFLVI